MYIRQHKQAQINKDIIVKTVLEIITIIEWEIKSRQKRSQRINTKPHSKASVKIFKRGQTVPSPYKWEQSQ